MTDPAVIRAHFPYITPDVACLQHVRKAGFVHPERLADHLLATALAGGVRCVTATLDGVEPIATGHRLALRHADGTRASIEARAVVLAVGPYLRRVGRLFGVDFPVTNEIHARVRARGFGSRGVGGWGDVAATSRHERT